MGDGGCPTLGSEPLPSAPVLGDSEGVNPLGDGAEPRRVAPLAVLGVGLLQNLEDWGNGLP